jgi:hypothetical protein
MRTRSLLLVVAGVATSAAVCLLAACGSSSESVFGNPNDEAGAGGSSGDNPGGGGFGGGGDASTRAIASLAIDPASATLDLTGAPFPTEQLTAIATFADGTTGPVPASWSATNAAVGGIDGSGLYTPRGTKGGLVTVTANAGGQTATATLTVKLHQLDNPAGADAATQAALLAATAADAATVWTYPYDGTAYPRGLNAPELMWNGGAGGDVYAIHVDSPTYELTSFTAASPVVATAGATPAGATSFAFDPAEWATFASSTSGDAKLTVTRKSGSSFTKVVDQTWKIASRSMSGTIYYWAINRAAVVRIKPGASAPDFFLSSATVPAPGEKNGSGVVTTQMFCPSCHTVSADGSTLAMGTGDWGGAGVNDVWSTLYDLAGGATTFHGYQTTNPATRYPLAALTPDGKVLVENWAKVRGNAMGKDDAPIDVSAPSGTTGTLLTGTDLEALVGAGHHTLFPVFSADDAMFAYVDSVTLELYALDWNPTTKKFSNKVKMAAKPASGKIAYPTISPDHRWIVYQLGPDYGSLDTSYVGDLYAIDTTKPLSPIALGAINTTKSGAATATRDEHRSYEATFAPVASGGYFWLVFHSRRTYGNRLVDVPYVNGSEGSGTKQLWVAALDVAGPGGPVTTDPSHPPFWLPGQDPTTRNMRGYWALDPCHPDGASCATGTDCCGGFCDATDDAGAPICGKSAAGCSQPGDKCDVAADCCNASAGVLCINHACAEPPPK